MSDLLKQINQLANQNKFKEIVILIEQMTESERDLEIVGAYVRALNNTWQLKRATEVSMQYRELGINDPLWHYRLGYACVNLNRNDEAAEVPRRAEGLQRSAHRP